MLFLSLGAMSQDVNGVEAFEFTCVPKLLQVFLNLSLSHFV